MRTALAALAAVAIIALVVPSSALGAVAFVQEQPVTVILEDGASTTVELFNGSPREHTLSLRVLGAPATELEISKPLKAPPGGTVDFQVELLSTRTQPISATLFATSTDGTSARLALHLGDQPPTRDVPKTLDAGVAKVNKTTKLTVADIPAETPKAAAGRLYRSGGTSVAVTVEKQTLRIGAAPKQGTYSGQIDVNGTAAGGVSALTLKARDGWLVALLVLLSGIFLGWLVELWLSRWRPRSLLDRRLGRLLSRMERRRGSVDRTLAGRYAESRPQDHEPADDEKPWRVPQAAAMATDQPKRYYFNRAGEELTKDLAGARTDPERELFGPGGDRFKALQTDAELYAALISDLREAAYVVRGALERLRDVAHVALRVRFDDEYDGFIVGDRDTLTARRETAKSLAAAAHRFADYYRRLETAEQLVEPGSELATRLEAHRLLLVDTFWGENGQVSWWDDTLPTLESEVHLPAPGGGTTPAPDGGATPAPSAVSTTVTEDADAQVQPPDEGANPPKPAQGPQTVVTNVPPWDAGGGTWRGAGFIFAEWLVIGISLIIIAATGMSSLYIANETFGSTGDYFSLVLWGSTATAALALLRRLFPGALKTMQAGG